MFLLRILILGKEILVAKTFILKLRLFSFQDKGLFPFKIQYSV